jgi:hypothetical protein
VSSTRSSSSPLSPPKGSICFEWFSLLWQLTQQITNRAWRIGSRSTSECSDMCITIFDGKPVDRKAEGARRSESSSKPSSMCLRRRCVFCFDSFCFFVVCFLF